LESVVRLCLVASKPTDSVTHGFLPAARRLGLDVTVLTDQPGAHEREYARRDYPSPHIAVCDVFRPDELIAAISALPAPDAVASNSDRLQPQTALAAEYLGLPGKDWRSAARAKHKSLMRRRLRSAGVENVTAVDIRPDSPRDPALPYPVVLKPADGVASEDVLLIEGPDELARACGEFFARHPGRALLAEEFLPGTLRTMETLGDGGGTRWVLGGFRTAVSPPPHFIEERLTWEPPSAQARDHVSAALDALGVSFGACHTEYVTGAATRLIEVNDRAIGDYCDFLLAEVTGLPLFELILRVHLGDRLPPSPPALSQPYAVAEYVTADRPGVLASVPDPSVSADVVSVGLGSAGTDSAGTGSAGAGPAGAGPAAGDGVTVTTWPLRRAGEQVAVTGTNRDYLGVICAAGPSRQSVDDAIARAAGQFRDGLRWAPHVPGQARVATGIPAATGVQASAKASAATETTAATETRA
jgi:biotin carboxylase